MKLCRTLSEAKQYIQDHPMLGELNIYMTGYKVYKYAVGTELQWLNWR